MFTAQEIKKAVEENREEAIQCLVEALRSPSPTGKEKPMADTMLRWLDKLDISVKTYEYMEDRPNIIAEWTGSQPGKRFLFNGHMDVFPPSEGEEGRFGPWSGEIADGYIYGRGADDMKSGDCAAYMAVKLLKQMGFDPKGSIVLNYVVDEENGSQQGVVSLLEDKLLNADIGISMEPSDMRIKLGHGGIYACQVIVNGDGGPAGLPMNTNGRENKYGSQDAIEKSVLALQALYKLRDHIRETKAPTDFGYSLLTVTNIHAGDATNTYARRCTITIDRRFLPDETIETVDAEIIDAMEKVKELDPTFDYEYVPYYEPSMPVYNVNEKGLMVTTMDEAFEELFGKRPEHFRSSGGTDASYITVSTGADMPWAGPGHHDDGPATADERVCIEWYLDCIKWYMLTLVKTMQ